MHPISYLVQRYGLDSAALPCPAISSPPSIAPIADEYASTPMNSDSKGKAHLDSIERSLSHTASGRSTREPIPTLSPRELELGMSQRTYLSREFPLLYSDVRMYFIS
jgi:hypothetical protein